MRYLHIANARVINPQTQTDEVTDVFVADGRIATLGRRPDAGEIEHTIDATGQWLIPGLIDLGGHGELLESDIAGAFPEAAH